MRLWFLIWSCMLALVAPATAQPPAANSKAARVTYDDHVLPILREKCLTCHSQDKKRGGLRLDNYTSLRQGGSSGEVVKPGDPDSSPLYLSMAHKREPFMPPQAPPITGPGIETIRKWIEGGTLENVGSKAVMVNKPKVELALTGAVRGKPAGPPPMPERPLLQEPVVRSMRGNAVTALAASPWAPIVAVGGHKQVLLYHSDYLDVVGVLPFPEGTPQVLKFSRNGELLLAGGGRGGKSGKAIVWSVKTGERVFEVGDELDAVLAADISSDQTQIALGGPSKIVRVYSTRDGKQLHEIKKHTDWIYALEFSPDGVLLASADRNGGLFIWESHTGREFHSLRGHSAAVTDLSWRPDSNVLASGSEDTTVRLWEMENGGQIKAWGAHGGGVQSVKYAQDGRIVTCGRDRVARLWDGNGGGLRTFEALPDLALRVAIAHDGSRVFCGDWTGSTRVWNAADGRALGQIASNPPSLAERWDIANKDLIAKQQAIQQLNAAAAAAQAAVQQTTVELANLQKAEADRTGAARIAAEAQAKSKEASDKAGAALAAAHAHYANKELVARSLSEAAAKIKEATAKEPANKELADLSAKCQAQAAQAVADRDAAAKVRAEVEVAARVAQESFAFAQRVTAAANVVAAPGLKQIEAKQVALKNVTANAAAAKAALDGANADLVLARARCDRMRPLLAAAGKPK